VEHNKLQEVCRVGERMRTLRAQRWGKTTPEKELLESSSAG